MGESIGILGGSFNPVHVGHLTMARDAQELFGLSRVLFVPCARPAHKPAHALESVEHRVTMLERALADEPDFELSRVELDREGISYAVDTVAALRAQSPGAQWAWIIGADTLCELHTWRRIEDLLEMCRFVTLSRPGVPVDEVQLPSPWPARLLKDVRTGHQMDISSSDIRKRVAHGRPIRYLVPEAVEAYILEQSLYLE